MNDIMNIVKPFESKKMMFAKLYIDIDWFEELAVNFPNRLKAVLYRYYMQLIRYEDLDYSEVLKFIDFINEGIIEKDEYMPIKLNFSLVNEGVVKLDSVFNENTSKKIIDIYKPYFYEFSGYCKSKEFKQLVIDYIKNECGYFKCYLDFSEEVNYDDKDVLSVVDGSVLFSASPIEEKSGKLVIVRSSSNVDESYKSILNDSIYRCKTKPIDKSEESCLHEAVDEALEKSSVPKYIKVYNVGQANNIDVKLSNNKHIFFDIGLTKSKIERNQNEIKKAIQEYRKIKANMILLSHWDLDHILGIYYANKNIYNALWVVPDLWGLMKYKYKTKKGVIKFSYISDSAKRLLKYLDYKNSNNLFIIDDKWTSSCIYSGINNNVCLWTGKRIKVIGKNEAKQCFSINEANNFGLILSVKNKKSALLCGDCDYSIIPNEIWKEEYEYIVASHHCSKMSKLPINKSLKNKKAILTYGITNNYGHPNNEHIKELNQVGYQIVTTLGNIYIGSDL